MREIQALKEELTRHQRAWNRTIILVNVVIKAIKTIKKGLIIVDIKVVSAEKDWLAF